MMLDLKTIRTVALDISGVNADHETQDETAELVWHLLQRGYQVYLFSTNEKEDLATEDFQHPRLAFLNEEMPPGSALLSRYPELEASTTLWVTEDAHLQDWIRQGDMPFASLAEPPEGSGGTRIPRWSELVALLDPTAFALDEIAAILAEQRHHKPGRPLLVGVGGPPLSGYQDFAVSLRNRLQSEDLPLVELMDLSTLLRSTDALLGEPDRASPWISPEVGRWVVDEVLEPLRAGRRVFVEHRPEVLPRDFDPHFPLFLSEESVVLVFGELLYTPEVAERLDISILLELDPEEMTRRLYEIPPDQRFDPKFTEQFQSREGRVYGEYLREARMPERASFRVDASRDNVFVLKPEPGAAGPPHA